MATSTFFKQAGGSRDCATKTDLKFALGHYNQAIAGMITVRPGSDLDIVVTASILLTVVELWRGIRVRR
ncbi:hypothetical protein N7507_000295 [Penicillium longicatenatum]|nr:hypothetical protein N7507_000295 [Penicillium longicatenatum]